MLRHQACPDRSRHFHRGRAGVRAVGGTAARRHQAVRAGEREAAAATRRSKLRGVPAKPCRGGATPRVRGAGAQCDATGLFLGSRLCQKLRSEADRRGELGGGDRAGTWVRHRLADAGRLCRRADRIARAGGAGRAVRARPAEISTRRTSTASSTQRAPARRNGCIRARPASNCARRRARQSAVIETLGSYFVRVIRFETAPANADPLHTAWTRIAAPSGKIGYAAPDTLDVARRSAALLRQGHHRPLDHHRFHRRWKLSYRCDGPPHLGRNSPLSLAPLRR